MQPHKANTSPKIEILIFLPTGKKKNPVNRRQTRTHS